ncbi:hypothetical protein CIN_12480 [Commensalibacter intestini A911]|uniref:Uncharacterized protein n=2 Tax=Commensalibacter intestini TaxID=479936 RepID=G6F195_9PROT|nr:hypothetical protein CIN_12480 [Commensalibacter intestini A911]
MGKMTNILIFSRFVRLVFLLVLGIVLINSSQAQEASNENSLLKLETYCPTSSSCIFTGENPFFIYTKIVNTSDVNLEIPLDAIKDSRIWGISKNIKTGEKIGRASGRPLANPDLAHKLTVLPAHSELLLAKGEWRNEIKENFHDVKANQFLYIVSIDKEAYYQGSSEPIGYYKNCKFEAKIFDLESQVIITKKKGLRLGHILKKKDRPVIVY